MTEIATRCACGEPLHYTDKKIEAMVTQLVNELGEYMPVNVILDIGEFTNTDEPNTVTYLVQRHYIALHGLKAVDLPDMLATGIVRASIQTL